MWLLPGCLWLTAEDVATRLAGGVSCDADGDGAEAITCGGDDCDDADAAVGPGAVEACDGVDQDCDGSVDEDAGTAWYEDNDGDGFGDPTAATTACDAPPAHVADARDCDDTDTAINPDAMELCNEADDDCDGSVDASAVDAPVWYADADGDGFGDAETTLAACTVPDGYVDNALDCDDAAAAVNPEGEERCNGTDDDCDGLTDPDDAEGAGTWYLDADGDGYGVADSTAVACEAPDDHVAEAGDCDDEDADVSPAGTEVCDGVDNDCSELADDDAGCPCEVDWDDDGDPYLFCYDTPRAFSEASTVCEAYGYHLVKVDDEDENTWMIDAAYSRTSSADFWLLGLSDQAMEGTFVWTDGTEPAYTNWYDGEPSNGGASGEDEDCTAVRPLSGYGYGWIDMSCTTAADWACEF